MKTFLLVLAAAGLSGCAVYPVPAYEAYGVEQPVYLYGGAAYRYGGYGYPNAYPRGYNRVPPHAFPRHRPWPQVHAPRPGQGAHDRDGDGVRNRSDRRPGNPRHR